MFCQKCGTEGAEGTFCVNCGTKLGADIQHQTQQAIYNQNKNTATGNMSLIFGLISMILWLIPIAGLPISIIGLVSGIKAKIRGANGKAIAGIVLSSIGIFATIVNAVVGATLGANGLLF